MNTNGRTTAMWVTIIVAIIISSSGLMYGIMQKSSNDKIDEYKEEIIYNRESIQELKEFNVEIKTELQYIKRTLNKIEDRLEAHAME